MFDPTTIHAPLRDCFFDASNKPLVKNPSHGATSSALLNARHGFPETIQRSPRSSPPTVSSSTALSQRSSRRIASIQNTKNDVHKLDATPINKA
eukprot:scaffold149726_cov62-Attheya_sp.AAC.1